MTGELRPASLLARTLMDPPEPVFQLVERAKSGDRAALERLFDLHRPRIEALVRTRLGEHLRCEMDVEDAIQETLVKALAAIRRFAWRGEDSFMRWVGTIAENVIRSAARRAGRRRGVPLAPDLESSDPGQSRILQREERFDRLQKALDALDPDSRRVIHLARVRGMPIRDVARELGRTPNATSILLYRALMKLRDKFGDTESLRLPDRRLEENR